MRFLSGIGSKRFVCLDWDARTLRMVEMAAGRGAARILNAAQATIPPDVQVSAADSVGAFIARSLREAGIKADSLIVDVPRQDAVLNMLTLPPTGENELPNMVRFQIGKELPFSLEQGVIDFAVLGKSETDGKSLQILVAAIRKHVLEYYEAVAEAADLELARVGLRPFANVQALTRDGHHQKGRIALVNVGPSMTEIDILRNGRLIFSRAAAVNVQARPAEDVAQPLARPEIIPFQSTGGGSSVDELLVEVTRTVEAYRAGDPGAKIDQVVVSGACGVEAELAQALGRRLETPTSLFEPPKEIERQAGRRSPVAWGGFGAALGLAWGHGQPALGHFDFVHPKEPVNVTKEKLRRVPVIAALVGLAVVSLVAGATIKVRDRVRTRDEYVKLEADEKKKLEAFKAFVSVVDAADAWRLDSIQWLDQLRAVVEALPESRDAYLREFIASDKGDMKVSIVARNAEVLNKFNDALVALKTPKHKPRFVVMPNSRTPSNDAQYPVQTDIKLIVGNYSPPPSAATQPSPATQPKKKDARDKTAGKPSRA